MSSTAMAGSTRLPRYSDPSARSQQEQAVPPGARQALGPQDVKILCEHYGASVQETEALVALALATRDTSWWHDYSDAVSKWFSLYADVEPAATMIRTYESELVYGLLQTSDYARAVIQAGRPEFDREELDRRAAIRMQRQAILDRAEPPQLQVVLNEAAVRRQVGGPDVMAKQVDKLRSLATRPNITIGILGYDVGAHAAMETTFTILDFPDPSDDPPLVYIEIPNASLYLKPNEYDRFAERFAQVSSSATPIQEFSL